MRKAALQSSINIYSSTRFSDAGAAKINRGRHAKDKSLMPPLRRWELDSHLRRNGENFYRYFTFLAAQVTGLRAVAASRR
jgi:hypothetical protein